jgi:hypothetical protein
MVSTAIIRFPSSIEALWSYALAVACEASRTNIRMVAALNLKDSNHIRARQVERDRKRRAAIKEKQT